MATLALYTLCSLAPPRNEQRPLLAPFPMLQFCNNCRANGIDIPSNRVFILHPKHEEGFFKRACKHPNCNQRLCSWDGLWLTEGSPTVKIAFSMFNDKSRCDPVSVYLHSALTPRRARALHSTHRPCSTPVHTASRLRITPCATNRTTSI